VQLSCGALHPPHESHWLVCGIDELSGLDLPLLLYACEIGHVLLGDYCRLASQPICDGYLCDVDVLVSWLWLGGLLVATCWLAWWHGSFAFWNDGWFWAGALQSWHRWLVCLLFSWLAILDTGSGGIGHWLAD